MSKKAKTIEGFEPRRGCRFIYIFQRPGNGVKIGISFNPKVRLVQISQQAGLQDVSIYAAFPVLPALAISIEGRAHELLRMKRGVGEWFLIEPVYAVAAIQEAMCHASMGRSKIALNDAASLLDEVDAATVLTKARKYTQQDAQLSAARARALAQRLIHDSEKREDAPE